MSRVGPVNKSYYDKLVTLNIRITLAFFLGAILAQAGFAWLLSLWRSCFVDIVSAFVAECLCFSYHIFFVSSAMPVS